MISYHLFFRQSRILEGYKKAYTRIAIYRLKQTFLVRLPLPMIGDVLIKNHYHSNLSLIRLKPSQQPGLQGDKLPDIHHW